MAAVGMTVGIGYAGTGLLLSIFIVASMNAASLFENRYIGPCRYRWAELSYRVDKGKSLVKIQEVLDEYRVLSKDRVESPNSDGVEVGELRLHYCDAHRHHREFLVRLAELGGVEGIRREPFADVGTTH